ncbi:Phosphoinositide phosphatase sac1, partial [Spiromyces aspiralis]
TRYFSRGADEDGNVSNFAETEQIVELESAPLKGGVLSHVQIRGSVPIDWYQNINLKYIPTLLINIEQSTDRFFRHFDRVIKDYRNVYAVNLVNKAKYEKPIGDQFTRLSREYANSQRGDEKGAESGRLYYTHFDFHKECSKMRWHRISLLIDEISGKLEEFGYYYQDPKGDVIHHQTGVIRTNCMDCLDRTNVVQSVVARFILTAQFRELEVLSSNETFDMFPQLEGMMRNIWADNADAVSCAYSGTGALKTDFTRTGKRTKIGAIQDGRNSIERYIRGNFLDGVRQDAMDLFLGKAQVVYGSDPFKRQLSLQCKMLLACLVVSLLMVVIGVIYAPFGYFTLKSTAFVVSWEGVTYLVAREVMKSHAAEVLNWPSLVPYPYRPQAVHVGEGLKVPIIGHYLENGLGAASTAADSTLTSQSSKPKRA